MIPKLFLKHNVSFEERLVLFQSVVDVPGWDIEKLVPQQIFAKRKMLAKNEQNFTT